MKEIIFGFFTEIGQKLAMLLLVGTAALTTGSAVSKVITKPNLSEVAVSDVKNDKNNSEDISNPNQAENINTPNPTEAISPKVNPKILPKILATITPSLAIPLATVTPKPIAVSTNNGCIVTISGQLFDVTTLRNTHSGGDVFKCGTDMTAIYQSKHGTSLSRMAKYAVNSNGTSTYINSGSNSTNTGKQDGTEDHDDGGDDDREDKQNEDRYVDEVDK